MYIRAATAVHQFAGQSNSGSMSFDQSKANLKTCVMVPSKGGTDAHLGQVRDHVPLEAQGENVQHLQHLLGEGGAVHDVVQESDLVEHQPR